MSRFWLDPWGSVRYRPPKNRADARAVDDALGPVEFAGVGKVGQQRGMDFLPDAGVLPLGESPPAGHAAAAVHLGGEVFPGESGLENEKDAGEGFAVVEAGSSAFGAGRVFGEQGFDEGPQSIRQ